MGLVGSELGLDRGTNGFEGVLDGATEAADHEFGANGGDPVGVALDLDGEAGREWFGKEDSVAQEFTGDGPCCSVGSFAGN